MRKSFDGMNIFNSKDLKETPRQPKSETVHRDTVTTPGNPELTEQEKECQEFVEANKKTVSEALVGLIKEKQFVLVGEHHLDYECEPIRQEIAVALVKLQQEGLTHIALEASASKQQDVDSLDFGDPKIKQILKEHRVGGAGWGEGNFDILIMAKRLGIKVILIDHNDGRANSARDNAQWQNERDTNMMASIQSQIDDKSKVLVFIGSAHVHKRSVEKFQDGRVTRLGTRLSEQYGSDTVSSIRHINQGDNFDGLLSFMSKTPTTEKISKGKKEVVILPDSGPIKGDERVTATDYLITII